MADYRFKFYPGQTAERLSTLARQSKKSLAATVRDLVRIASANLPEDGETGNRISVADYRLITGIGRKIAGYARTHDERGLALPDSDLPHDDKDGHLLGHDEVTARIIGWADGALRFADELWERTGGIAGDLASGKQVKVKLEGESDSAASIKITMGSERQALGKLAAISGVSMNAVLRALVMGMPLPDRIAWRTGARISQVGALARHIANVRAMPERDARRLRAAGAAIGALAARMTGIQAERQAAIVFNPRAS